MYLIQFRLFLEEDIIMISLFAHIKNYFDSTTNMNYQYILTKTMNIYNNISLKKLNQSFY